MRNAAAERHVRKASSNRSVKSKERQLTSTLGPKTQSLPVGQAEAAMLEAVRCAKVFKSDNGVSLFKSTGWAEHLDPVRFTHVSW